VTRKGAAIGRKLCWGTVCVLIALSGAASASARMTPAELERFDAQKKILQLSDGEALAYLDVGPRQAVPLVLIHGYTDSARDWAPIAPFLSRKFRLIIVDLRGQGASGKPECCYTRFDFAYDVKLLLDRLQLSSAVIVGHSLGSLVAQTFAEQWPAMTRRLVLISSTGTSFGSGPGWLEGVQKLKDPIDPDSSFMRAWWHESTRINPAFFSSRQRLDAAAIPARVWRAIADQSLLGVDLRFMLPRISAPALLIWGGQDTLEGPAGRAALRSGIRGARVADFPALGHDLIWQDPKAVAQVMTRFIESPR
jgi:pimeloyl-ACP methyl ester carboxylesterase